MFHLADSLMALAQGHLINGRHAEARQAVVEAIALFADADNKAGIGLGLESLLSSRRARDGKSVRSDCWRRLKRFGQRRKGTPNIRCRLRSFIRT